MRTLCQAACSGVSCPLHVILTSKRIESEALPSDRTVTNGIDVLTGLFFALVFELKAPLHCLRLYELFNFDINSLWVWRSFDLGLDSFVHDDLLP